MAFTNGAARFRMKNPSPGSCYGGFGRPGEGMVETGDALTTTTRRTPTAFIAWTIAHVPCEAIPASEIDRGPRADSTASVPSTAESDRYWVRSRQVCHYSAYFWGQLFRIADHC